MSVKTRIKALLANEDLQIKELAEMLSQKKNITIKANSISQKLIKENMKFNEVEEILEILGYYIIFQKR